MSKEKNKNIEELNDEISLTSENINLPEVSLGDSVVSDDGIEVISDDSLENYSEEVEENEEILSVLTFEEKKKLLRYKLKKSGDKTPVTDEMVDALSEDDVNELKEIAKISHRKALISFVSRKKIVTDEEAENLTEEEFLNLTNKALVMSRFLTYNPKKKFGSDYKKNRQRKNRVTKRQRAINRR